MSADWDELRQIARELAPEAGERLAREWARDAQLAHTSIASFGRFALELQAVGAPSELVESAHRAAIDEIDHARVCFSLVSVYGGQVVGPGPVPLPTGAFAAPTLISMAHATVLEGCVNETIAALEAKVAAAHAQPAAVRDALLAIERQESDHASLAFRFVGWAIARGGREVRAAARAAFALANERTVGTRTDGGALPAALEDTLAQHGRLSERARSELRHRALREVIAPAARALLG
jgi:hypothetical protein